MTRMRSDMPSTSGSSELIIRIALPRAASSLMSRYQPLALAVLGEEGDAGPDGVPRVGQVHRPAVHLHPAAVRPVRPEDEPGRLGPARADQAGQPHDLATADHQRDAADLAAAP